MRIFAAYIWHTESWTPRNEAILEAVLKRARATKHPWLAACDADMSPVDFEKKSSVSKRSDACDSTRGSIIVQVEVCQRRMG